MSFARWDTLEACQTEQMQIGHTPHDAETICLGIKERADQNLLFKAAPTLDILKSSDTELVVAGPASWECEDYEHDIVTTEAQVNFLRKFFQLPPEYRNISIDHSNFQIATAIPRWPEDHPTVFSHVHEKGMYLIAKVRSDNLAHSQQYRQLIRDGVYKMFSISGKPLRCDGPCNRRERTEQVRKIFDIDPVEVGIVKEGMNQKAGPLIILKHRQSSPMQKQTHLTIEEIQDTLIRLEAQRDTLYAQQYPEAQENVQVREQLILIDVEIQAIRELLGEKLKAQLQKEDLQKPFADYANHADCVEQNTGKVSDPHAFCAWLEHQTTGSWPAEKLLKAHWLHQQQLLSKKRTLSLQEQTEQLFKRHFPTYQSDQT